MPTRPIRRPFRPVTATVGTIAPSGALPTSGRPAAVTTSPGVFFTIEAREVARRLTIACWTAGSLASLRASVSAARHTHAESAVATRRAVASRASSALRSRASSSVEASHAVSPTGTASRRSAAAANRSRSRKRASEGRAPTGDGAIPKLLPLLHLSCSARRMSAPALSPIEGSRKTQPIRAHHRHSHGLVDRSILRSHAGIRAVALSLAVLGTTALVQALILTASGSVALLADLIHNIGDALTAIPLGIAFFLRSHAWRADRGLLRRARDLRQRRASRWWSRSSGCCTRAI